MRRNRCRHDDATAQCHHDAQHRDQGDNRDARYRHHHEQQRCGRAAGAVWGGAKDATFTLTLPVRMTRTGRTLRLIQSDGRAVAATPPDPSIIKLLVKAHRWWARLRQGDITVRELAEAEGVVKSYVTRVTRLAFLSPAIVDDILAGRQRAGLDAKRLALTADLPTRWSEQQETWAVTPR
jgi:hypothetical protein